LIDGRLFKVASAAALGVALAGSALAQTPSQPQSAEQSAAAPRQKRVVEVAFTLDATGSMASLIDGAKRKIWAIATAVADANPDAEIRMGLVAYRDVGDEFVTKTFDLSTDIQAMYGELLALKANGGGDWPESVNEALDKTVTGLSWTQGSNVDRIVFLVGDAPAHMDYKQDRKYPDILKDAAARGLRVNAVQAGDAQDTRRMWREIAQRGGGDYIPIPQDGGQVVVIDTPFDDEIIVIQRKINETIVPYGDMRRQRATMEKAERAAAAPKSTASDMAGYMARKAGKTAEAVTGGGDLVSAMKKTPEELSKLKDEELPQDLRGKSREEQTAYLEKKFGERGALTKQMAELVAKRDAFVAKQRAAKAPGEKDAFDAVVAKTLQTQIHK
jgi:hypothetical protein